MYLFMGLPSLNDILKDTETPSFLIKKKPDIQKLGVKEPVKEINDDNSYEANEKKKADDAPII